MRLIIAGGRDYYLSGADYRWLDEIHAVTPVSQVISGGASGADHCGEFWARTKSLPCVVMQADWKLNGKAAGPVRNEAMAKVADAVALFPGGKGTASMRSIAKRYGLRIFER